MLSFKIRSNLFKALWPTEGCADHGQLLCKRATPLTHRRLRWWQMPLTANMCVLSHVQHIQYLSHPSLRAHTHTFSWTNTHISYQGWRESKIAVLKESVLINTISQWAFQHRKHFSKRSVNVEQTLGANTFRVLMGVNNMYLLAFVPYTSDSFVHHLKVQCTQKMSRYGIFRKYIGWDL